MRRPRLGFPALALALALLADLCFAAAAQTPAAPQLAAHVSIPPERLEQAQEQFAAGARAEQAGDVAAAFQAYAEASALASGNREYRLRRELARFALVQEHVSRAERAAAGGQFSQARREFQTALALDPGYDVARERLAQIEQMAGRAPGTFTEHLESEVALAPEPGKRSFDYRGDIQGAYQEVARQFGLVASFDPDLPERQIRFRVGGVDFPTAIRLLAELTATFWRPTNPKMFFVAENTPAKRAQYAPSVLRSIPLPESDTPEEMTEIQRLVRTMTDLTRTDLDVATRTLTLRGTPEQINLALELIRQTQQSPGELMFEIDILEVDRNKAEELGIIPPSRAQIFAISPSQITEAQQSVQGLIDVITQLFGQPSSIAGLQLGQIEALLSSGQLSAAALLPPVVAFGGGKTTFLATLPGATANFAQTLSLVKSGQHVLLRAEDGHPATFFVGERFPISLAGLSPSFGQASVVPVISSSNFPRTDLPTGTTPVAVAIGDFNGDKLPDLAVANQGSNTVSIFLNQGGGTFGAKTDFATGEAPSAIAIGDFNQDGNLDLAVVNQKANTVSILLGNGDGTFQPKVDFPTGNTPVAVVAGDFNGDGIPDLAIVNKTDNTVSILLGKGDGTFGARKDFPTGNSPVAVVAGDFNGDGKLDLAVVNQTDNTVSVMIGNGDGTFKPRVNYASGTGPASIAAADFNRDGVLDLAVANQTDNTVSVLIGNGDGTFQTKIDFATGEGPASLAAADFNLDGFPDLAVADKTANTLSILLNNGSGNLSFRLDLPVGAQPVSVASADLVGDGRTDAAVANQASNTVSVILNQTVFISGAGTTLTPYPAAQYEDLGLKVKATPRIHPAGEVTLELEFEIRSLSGVQLNGIPVISNRTVDQTVRLREGRPTLLVALLHPQESEILTGWPGLERIFGNRSTQREQTELLFLLTPRLVRQAPRKAQTIYAGTGEAH
jgi:type II secretory pathway component GspD/PulD (secretin)